VFFSEWMEDPIESEKKKQKNIWDWEKNKLKKEKNLSKSSWSLNFLNSGNLSNS